MELISEGAVDKINFMKNRELERKLDLQRKQDTKMSKVAENEQMDFFQRTFNEKQNFIESLLKKSHTLPKGALPDHFNTISKEILLLQKYVAASSLFLRNYFLQKCQKTLQQLSAEAAELENDLIPKKKFGFKNKPKSKEAVGTASSDTVDFCQRLSPKIDISNIECGFYDKSHEVLRLSGAEIAKKDVSLELLNNCKVYLQGLPSTLHLNHLDNCQIFTGPVSTSIFAENCHNCTLVIACQQLRLHASRNIKIYLHVTSRAIMEDCHDIYIAPYNWNYQGIEDDFLQAGLDKRVNNWRCVDDFNWLNAEKHSPHWQEMQDVDMVKEWS